MNRRHFFSLLCAAIAALSLRFTKPLIRIKLTSPEGPSEWIGQGTTASAAVQHLKEQIELCCDDECFDEFFMEVWIEMERAMSAGADSYCHCDMSCPEENFTVTRI